MVFPNIEDIVENIVDEVFLDKLTEEGYYDYDGLPKNFAKLALVSRNFVNAVRRNIYTELLVDGPERFLLLTGQLRSSPHLAKLVKRASLNSSCNERAHIDGFESGTPGDGEPRTVSITALKWFLEACPQLSKLELHGGDFLYALSSPNIVQSAERLTEIGLHACNHHHGPRASASDVCAPGIHRGWLKHIVALPHLKELDLSDFAIGGPHDPTVGIPRASSPRELAAQHALAQGAGPRWAPAHAKGGPLSIVAPTLTLLTLTDYHSYDETSPQPWEDNTVSNLHHLETLAFNGVPVTPALLGMLPSHIQHLRFSGHALNLLPAPAIAKWLSRETFPLRGILRKLDIVGNPRANSALHGPKASDAQVAELARLCHGLGIEWSHQVEQWS
ncbi:hypothetical protein B0H10DRAFT_2241827 [Mycena sp. CBHHK59/15]|nr:hypothetical protein B0H10DRAFT_2241827 [Mycena sp. CBHHK59/15]